ncbi:MAG: Uncharacterised protein [Hyphomonas sp. TMED17]|nr:MAG: Uncharacterised protein [Hyphomonas sp. TMED17]
MSRLLEACKCIQIIRAAFDVGVSGFIIVNAGAVLFEHRIGFVETRGFDIDNKFRVRVFTRQVAGEH